MFIKLDYSGYGHDGQQKAGGLFLILMQPDFTTRDPKKEMKAVVRRVRMSQFGHFMMGRARIANRSIILSGSYGHDGLPVAVEPEIYDKGVLLPQELYDAWNKGDGWNSTGSEAPLMKEWAFKYLKELRA